VGIFFTGIFGALTAYILVRVLRNRIRIGANDGSLGYSSLVLALGWLLIICAGLVAKSMYMGPTPAPDVPRGALMVVLGLAGLFLLCQGVLTRGWIDASGIRFKSAFGGKVDELWRDLASVRYNRHCAWYVLTFKSGKTIRLSMLLCGYGGVLHLLRARGHNV